MLKSVKNCFMAAAVLFSAAAVSTAQVRTIEHDYSAFDGINASNKFKVTVVLSENYSAKLTIDDALESYVQCYVKGGQLYIGLDEKNIPKDLKKAYKGKNASEPTLNAVVNMPVLNSLTLSDEAAFMNTSTINSDNFTLTLNDETSITNLSILAGKSATLNVNKKAKLSSSSVKCDGDIALNGDGKASVTVEFIGNNVTLNNAGSAEIAANGECKKLSVNTSGSSKTTVSGKAEGLVVNGKGGKVDASALPVYDAAIAVTGSDVIVNAANTLELDLGRGAEITYSDEPVIKINKIQNASVIRK